MFLLRLLIASVAVVLSVRATNPPVNGGVWPLPQSIQYDGEQRRLLDSFSITIEFHNGDGQPIPTGQLCETLKYAKTTYEQHWFFSYKADSAGTRFNDALRMRIDDDNDLLASNSIEKDVDDGHRRNGNSMKLIVESETACNDAFPQQDMREDYKLTVPLNGDAHLTASDVWGVLRGLETLSQLVYWSGDDQSFVIRTATVKDWPEYSIRGVLIDTSRHFLSQNIILRLLDLMAQNKMNLLHWHIVDIQSFPYVSKNFPNLSKEGAYSQTHLYTPAMVQAIIERARNRGVRVMMEYDSPGHMSSWVGQPGLLSDCRDAHDQPVEPQLIDPTENENYAFLRQFWTEVYETFPEKIVHLGGDEVEYGIETCWKHNKKVLAFMKKHNLHNMTELEDYYFGRLEGIMQDLNNDDSARHYIFWDEVFFNNKPKQSAIIHLWRPPNEAQRNQQLAKITQAGHNVILSSCWYLNEIIYGNDWMAGDDLHRYYYCDPRNFDGTPAQKALVLGGVAAIWGEYVDSANFEARLWPRASAVAERLWSNAKSTSDAERAWPRLHEHRCRMVARGYRAQPAYGPDSCPDEYDDPLPL